MLTLQFHLWLIAFYCAMYTREVIYYITTQGMEEAKEAATWANG